MMHAIPDPFFDLYAKGRVLRLEENMMPLYMTMSLLKVVVVECNNY